MNNYPDFETIEAWICGRATEAQLEAIHRDLTSESGSKVCEVLRHLNETVEKILGRPEDRGKPATVADSLAWLERNQEYLLDADQDADEENDQPDRIPVDDFVRQEVLRLLQLIKNPSALLDREELRRFRDSVIEKTRSAGWAAGPGDDLVIHMALARIIRPIRWENARVTYKSGMGGPNQEHAAMDLLVKLTAQNRVLSDYRANEHVSHVAQWYILGEDAALTDDEIAGIAAKDRGVIREALRHFRTLVINTSEYDGDEIRNELIREFQKTHQR